ncbi:hypothetical protein A7A76_10225 [Lysobacter enzymogenes]|uniref:Fic family protein n=1 Tax=Lysobacter enzymogenes TaxID=69 RepID=UPI0019D16705|nr:Fic family protein [Lysobacter enzymogenes]MBN7135134.1 hypothetical protein [Lysobacter enzymogenes]
MLERDNDVATPGDRHAAVDAPSFSPRIGLPMGRFDTIASALTGAPLTYFTPDSAVELIARCAPTVSPRAPASVFAVADRSQALVFARAASRAASSGVPDTEQARRLCRQWLRPQAWRSEGELVALAGSIAPSVRGPRNTIAFAGAPTASVATHIFAPASAVPEGLRSLAEAMHAPHIDAAASVALIAFYAIHLHPFADGNGRWARLLALSAGMRADPHAAWYAAVLLSVENRILCDRVWPQARRAGAATYLRGAYEFERRLGAALDGDAALGAALSGINAVLRGAARGSRTLYEELLVDLYAAGELSLAQVRVRCALSARLAGDLPERLRAGAAGLARVDADRLDIRPLIERAECAIEAACQELWDT